MAKRLTHLDEKGAARMVDVADKIATVREATAECIVRMAPDTLRAVREGTAKGDALQVARVAGIMGAKRTPDLIPLCHPLPLSSVTVDFEFVTGAADLRCCRLRSSLTYFQYARSGARRRLASRPPQGRSDNLFLCQDTSAPRPCDHRERRSFGRHQDRHQRSRPARLARARALS